MSLGAKCPSCGVPYPSPADVEQHRKLDRCGQAQRAANPAPSVDDQVAAGVAQFLAESGPVWPGRDGSLAEPAGESVMTTATETKALPGACLMCNGPLPDQERAQPLVDLSDGPVGAFKGWACSPECLHAWGQDPGGPAEITEAFECRFKGATWYTNGHIAVPSLLPGWTIAAPQSVRPSLDAGIGPTLTAIARGFNEPLLILDRPEPPEGWAKGIFVGSSSGARWNARYVVALRKHLGECEILQPLPPFGPAIWRKDGRIVAILMPGLCRETDEEVKG